MWTRGIVRIGETIYTYWAKKYTMPGRFGINGGRISKLSILRDGREVAAYDRGWDIEPVDAETQAALETILRDEN